jgi:hypothetical protein
VKQNPLVALGGSALLVSLFLVYGALAGQMTAQYAMQTTAMQAAALSSSQTTAAPSAGCYGGEVFVYSKDFSDAIASNSNRTAELHTFTCYQQQSLTGSAKSAQWVANPNPSASMNFLEYQILNSVDACHVLPQANASQCAVVYYAVVPNRGVSVANSPNPNHIPSKIDSQICAFKTIGQSVQASDCAKAAQLIAASAGPIPSSWSSTKQYPVIAPSVPQTQSVTQLVQKYAPIPLWTGAGGSMPSGGAPTEGTSLIPPKTIGVQWNFRF